MRPNKTPFDGSWKRCVIFKPRMNFSSYFHDNDFQNTEHFRFSCICLIVSVKRFIMWEEISNFGSFIHHKLYFDLLVNISMCLIRLHIHDWWLLLLCVCFTSLTAVINSESQVCGSSYIPWLRFRVPFPWALTWIASLIQRPFLLWHWLASTEVLSQFITWLRWAAWSAKADFSSLSSAWDFRERVNLWLATVLTESWCSLSLHLRCRPVSPMQGVSQLAHGIL